MGNYINKETNDDFSEDGKSVSTFNDGNFQPARIDKIQGSCHDSYRHFLHFFEDENLYGYEIFISDIDCMYVEVESYLNEDERNKVKKFRSEIYSFLEDNPIYRTEMNPVLHTPETKPNRTNYYKLRELLFNYQLFVRRLLKEHKLIDSKDSEEAEYIK